MSSPFPTAASPPPPIDTSSPSSPYMTGSTQLLSHASSPSAISISSIIHSHDHYVHAALTPISTHQSSQISHHHHTASVDQEIPLVQQPDPIDSSKPPRAKIICSLSASSSSSDKIKSLLLHGMNVARINLATHDHETHRQTIQCLREVSNETRRICAILLDTQGPSILTGKFKDNVECVYLTKQQEIMLTTDDTILGDQNRIAILGYVNLTKSLKNGDHIVIDHGQIELEVLESNLREVRCRILKDGTLYAGRPVMLPNVHVELPAVTQKDVNDIRFAMEQCVDFLCISHVRKGNDISTLRKIVSASSRSHSSSASSSSSSASAQNVKIIAKIQNADAMDNFDQILALADGIFIERRDLVFELSPEKLDLCQKYIIRACNLAGKFVITSTSSSFTNTSSSSQLTSSLPLGIQKAISTCSEKYANLPLQVNTHVIAQSIIDGTDCILLNDETNKGNHPIESLKLICDICRHTESLLNWRVIARGIQNARHTDDASDDVVTISVMEAIASAAVRTSFDLKASIIIVLTETGTTARLVSKYRPKVPIITITSSEQTARQSLCYRGLFPLLVGSMIGTDSLTNRVLLAAQRLGMCKAGDLAVITSGAREGTAGATNDLKVIQVGA